MLVFRVGVVTDGSIGVWAYDVGSLTPSSPELRGNLIRDISKKKLAWSIGILISLLTKIPVKLGRISSPKKNGPTPGF